MQYIMNMLIITQYDYILTLYTLYIQLLYILLYYMIHYILYNSHIRYNIIIIILLFPTSILCLTNKNYFDNHSPYRLL